LTLSELHGVISKKMILFITTAVKTSNLTALEQIAARKWIATHSLINHFLRQMNTEAVDKLYVAVVKDITPVWAGSKCTLQKDT
jgi:hypothetical protein